MTPLLRGLNPAESARTRNPPNPRTSQRLAASTICGT